MRLCLGRQREMLENGTHATIAELAAAEKINESYVGRVLRVTLLAPDIRGGNPEWAAAGEAAAQGTAEAVSGGLAELRRHLICSIFGRSWICETMACPRRVRGGVFRSRPAGVSGMYESAPCCARMTITRADDVGSPEQRDDALLKPSLGAQSHEADAALAGAEPTQKRILALAMKPFDMHQ
jgi:hypothetical protein